MPDWPVLDQGQLRRYGLELGHAAGLPSGTIHPILARLERMSWLESAWEDIDPHQQGRPRRRYYTLTPDGAERARDALARAHTSTAAITRLRPGLAGGPPARRNQQTRALAGGPDLARYLILARNLALDLARHLEFGLDLDRVGDLVRYRHLGLDFDLDRARDLARDDYGANLACLDSCCSGRRACRSGATR